MLTTHISLREIGIRHGDKLLIGTRKQRKQIQEYYGTDIIGEYHFDKEKQCEKVHDTIRNKWYTTLNQWTCEIIDECNMRCRPSVWKMTYVIQRDGSLKLLELVKDIYNLQNMDEEEEYEEDEEYEEYNDDDEQEVLALQASGRRCASVLNQRLSGRTKTKCLVQLESGEQYVVDWSDLMEHPVSIYIMADLEPALMKPNTKIGLTNQPLERWDTMKTSCPHGKMVKIFTLHPQTTRKEAQAIENKIHHALRHVHNAGEFFYCTVEQAEEMCLLFCPKYTLHSIGQTFTEAYFH